MVIDIQGGGVMDGHPEYDAAAAVAERINDDLCEGRAVVSPEEVLAAWADCAEQRAEAEAAGWRPA